MRTIVLALFALACNGDEGGSTKPDDTGTPLDVDGDGYAGDADCDDNDASVYSGAPELCDGIDNDCDGSADDQPTDGTTYYADADADGYGDPASSKTACDLPAGYVENGEDCDDTNADVYPGAEELDCTDPTDYNCDGEVGASDADGDGVAACEGDCDDADATTYPGAAEVCNDKDDDCDGDTDSTATDMTTWYTDADADGYGDAAGATTTACDQPEGYAGNADDCNDADAAYHPGADESDCSDPNDYNCDGSVGYADADGDGEPACTDCDDANPDANTSGTEVCDGADNDCDGSIDEDVTGTATWYADADGDSYGDPNTSTESCEQPSGYVADNTDCDDAASATYPGAAEYCDGVDTDCDGTADSAASDWYADADGDGYGDASDTVNDCAQPSGYVSDGTDCDDADGSSYPGADEYCDGVDNNCDGTTDEDTAVDAGTYYADTDGDTYGDGTVSAVACSATSGWVSDDTDCDDTDGAVNPGADEYCDGVDNNCDGSTDEDTAVDADTWYTDGDGDGYGDPGSTSAACSMPTGSVDNGDDCDDTASAVNPGATETCNGADDDCDGDTDEAGATGASTYYADDDGDGYGDAASTATSCSLPSGYSTDNTDCDDADATSNPGATEVCDDGADNDCDGDDNGCELSGTTASGSSDLILYGASSGDALGGSVAVADCDGDGNDDLLAGAATVNGSGSGTGDIGRAYLFYGPLDGSESLSDYDASFSGTDNNEYLSSSSAALDIDGDGEDEVALGAYAYDNGTNTTAGRVVLFADSGSGDSDASSASATILLAETKAYVGWDVANGGDYDGDGNDDLIVSASLEDASGLSNPGSFGVFYSGTLSGSLNYETDADVRVTGQSKEIQLGYAVAGNVDVDGDGTADLVATAPTVDITTSSGGTTATDAGAVCFFSGDTLAAADGGDSNDADSRIHGGAASDQMGWAVTLVDDQDGDGYGEVLVGAHLNDDGGTDAGAAYLFGNPASSNVYTSDAVWMVYGATAGDYLGKSVAAAGDVNGDGDPDILVGGTAVDNGTTSGVGAVYLFYGGGLSGSVAASSMDFKLRGAGTSDAVGSSAGGPIDLNSDGYYDILTGAVGVDGGATNTGAVYGIFGGGI